MKIRPSRRSGKFPPTLTGIVETLIAAAGNGAVTLGDFLRAMGRRGIGVMLILPCLLIILPIGLLPGVPGLAAILMLLIAGHMLLGRETLWLPARLRRLPLPSERLKRELVRFHPLALRIDGWMDSRFTGLAQSRFAAETVALVTIVLSLLILLIGFIPGVPAAFALAILVFAVGLGTANGVLILLGYAGTALLLAITFWLVR